MTCPVLSPSEYVHPDKKRNAASISLVFILILHIFDNYYHIFTRLQLRLYHSAHQLIAADQRGESGDYKAQA